MSDQFRNRTERDTGAYPDNWPKPTEGDFIIGEVTAIEISAGKYDQPVLGVLCEDNDTEFSVWLPSYLATDIQSQGLKVGERVAVKYHGLKRSAGGRDYQHYTLRIDPHKRLSTPFEPEPDPRDNDGREVGEGQGASDPSLTEPDDSLPF